MTDGTYVTVEGIDGVGKSTLISNLKHDVDAERTREPADWMWTGKAVREALSQDTAPETDLLLFLADRSEHLRRVVRPAIEKGEIVISDRGIDSTYAYQVETIDWDQGFWSWLDKATEPWSMDPDVTFLLDMEPEAALERIDAVDKYEENLPLLRAVRENYHTLVQRDPDRFYVLDATKDPDELAAEAAEIVRSAHGL